MRIVGLLNSGDGSTHLDIVGFCRQEITQGWLDATIVVGDSTVPQPLSQTEFDSFVGGIRCEMPNAPTLDVAGPYHQRLIEVEFGSADRVALRGMMQQLGLGDAFDSVGTDVVAVSRLDPPGFELTQSLEDLIARCERIVGIATCPLHHQPPVCQRCASSHE